jgi:hypothetical protein
MDETGDMQMSEDQLLQYLQLQTQQSNVQVLDNTSRLSTLAATGSNSGGIFADQRFDRHLISSANSPSIYPFSRSGSDSLHLATTRNVSSNIEEDLAYLNTSCNSKGIACASDALINMRQPNVQSNVNQSEIQSSTSQELVGSSSSSSSEPVIHPTGEITAQPEIRAGEDMEVSGEVPITTESIVAEQQTGGRSSSRQRSQRATSTVAITPASTSTVAPRRMVIELRRRKRDEK